MINTSDKTLSIEEEDALRLGLKHHILPRNIDGIQIKAQVEQLWQFAKKTIVSSVDPNIESEMKDGVRQSTLSFLHGAKNVCGSRTNQNFHRTLRNLKKDQDIKICSFDKGNGIVIVNSKEYFEKLDTIVLDKSKFEEITINQKATHPVIRNETAIRKYLR